MIALGAAPIDSDELEARYTAPLDTRFARVSRMLIQGSCIATDDIVFVLRFLGIARARTPAWLESQGIPTLEAAHAHARSATTHLVAAAQESLREYGLTMEDYENADRANSYQMLVLSMIAGQIDPFMNDAPRGLSVKLLVLKSDGDASFVLSDSPMRNFDPNDLTHIRRSEEPGLRERGILAAYPIGPVTALAVHMSPGRPLCEYKVLSKPLVQRINSALLAGAHKELIVPSSKAFHFDVSALNGVLSEEQIPFSFEPAVNTPSS